ncbi:MAG: hypothetical protein WCT24_01600 [Patescibacteria group bacterium]
MDYSRIGKTGFLVSIISYVVFWLADFWRTGFVSTVFSVHWFLLFAWMFGALWMLTTTTRETRLSKLLIATLCLIFFIVLWKLGDVFGDLQILLAFFGALVPVIGFVLLSHKNEQGTT